MDTLVQGLECYKEVEQTNEQELFVKKYSPLVYKVAHYIHKNTSDSIELDDLLQSGLIGLLEAKDTFDNEAGASFSTYATIKVRYAIYEYIRKASGITREISQNIKKISQATTKLENEATSQNVAQELGLTPKKYSDMMTQINTYKSLSISESLEVSQMLGEGKDNPLEWVESEDFKQMMRESLRALPKREQHILALYYNEQISFKQIADILGFTEARISQLHTQALDKLKRRIEVGL